VTLRQHLRDGRRRRFSTVAVAGSLAVAAAAFGGSSLSASSPPSDSSGDASADVPARRTGGTAVMVATAQVVLLDPQLQRVSFAFTDAPMMSAVYGNLAWLDPDTGELHLYFLESLEPNDDYSVWTMTLHPNIMFSDGTPMDAEAIRYNMARAADPDVGSRFYESAAELELEVIDDLTLQVTLPGPNPSWYATLVSDFAGVGSPTAMEQAKADGTEFGSVPVGAGPFMVKDWTPGQTLTVERNPYFAEFRPGEPYLDEITFKTVPDQVQQVNALLSGAGQLVAPTGADVVDELTEFADITITRTSGGSDIFLNNSIPPFDDPRARQAIWYALDQAAAADAFAAGTPPARSMFAEASPFYDPAYEFPEQDPEEAQRLFDELAAEGKPVEFSYLTLNSAAQTTFSDYLLAELGQYDNVSVTIDVRTSDEYTRATRTGEYQAIPHGAYFSNPIPTLVDTFHPEGLLNSFEWENETVSAAFDSLGTATTEEEQREVWNTVQEQFLADLPIYFVGQGVIGFATVDDLVAPTVINYGNNVLWGEVGYAE
jgi:ABC-type transport system substrate-binding protein